MTQRFTQSQKRDLYALVHEWLGGVATYENPECALIASLDAARERRDHFVDQALIGRANAQATSILEPREARTPHPVSILHISPEPLEATMDDDDSLTGQDLQRAIAISIANVRDHFPPPGHKSPRNGGRQPRKPPRESIRFSLPYDPAQDWPTLPQAGAQVHALSEEGAELVRASASTLREACRILEEMGDALAEQHVARHAAA